MSKKTDSDQGKKRGSKSSIIKASVLVLLLLGCFIAVLVTDIESRLVQIISWIEEIGNVGYLIYAGVYFLATVLFVPGSLLTLGAGALFGLGWGIVIVGVGATLGACGAFLVGKYFMRDWVTQQVARFPRFDSIYKAISDEGGKIIFFLRLSPLFPFNMSNYLYSLTSVKFIPYTLATLCGILPGTAMYVYFGTVLGDLARLSQPRERTPIEWMLYGVGLIATIFITIYAARVAKKAISKTVS